MKAKKTTTKTTKAKVTKPKAKKTAVSNTPVAHGVGRRKKAVARVWLRRSGNGTIVVNGKEYTEYFDTEVSRLEASEPMRIVPVASGYDIEVNVEGGGLKGQAGAVKLGIARAFLATDEAMRSLLRTNKLLTVDDRRKERKKYGQRGARRKFQFVKR